MKLGNNSGKAVKFLNGIGVEAIAGAVMMPRFDRISLIRSFEEFCMDIYDGPELLHDALRQETPGLIQSTLRISV